MLYDRYEFNYQYFERAINIQITLEGFSRRRSKEKKIFSFNLECCLNVFNTASVI